MRILADWEIHISYPAALRAEMVSMLAKYVPGGVWTPAARVVAARRAGITDARARDGLDPRRGGDLGRRRRCRVRRLARLGARCRRADRAAGRVRGRRGGPPASPDLLSARVAGPAQARARCAAAAACLDDGVPARLLLRHVGDRRLSAVAAAARRRCASGRLARSSSSAASRRSARSWRCWRSSRRRVSGRARRRCTGSWSRSIASGAGARRDRAQPRRDHGRRGAPARRRRAHPSPDR